MYPVAKIVDVKIKSSSSQLEPLRVSFNHANLKANVADHSEVGLFSDSLNDNEYIAICKKDDMFYMGNTVTEPKDQNVFIAIRNKLTSKTKLVQVSKVSLSPAIEFPKSTNPDLLDDENSEKKTNSDLRKEFVHKFGMLKGQRLYDQAERLTVKSETLQANITDAAQNSSVTASDLLPKIEISYDYLLPPRNTSAAVASEVYQLKDIIAEEDSVSLAPLATYCLEADQTEVNSWGNEKRYSPLFMSHVNRLRKASSMDEKTKLQLTEALIYNECLIKLSSLKFSVLKTFDPLGSDFPHVLQRRVKDKFYPVSKGMPTKMDKERIYCHIIVLALIIGDRNVDAKLLCDSLHISATTLTPLVRVIGAQYLSDKVSGLSNICLRLPLTAPVSKPPMKRKKK